MLATTSSAQFKNGNQATELALPTLSQHASSRSASPNGRHDQLPRAAWSAGRKLYGAAPVPYDKVLALGKRIRTRRFFLRRRDNLKASHSAAGTYGLHMIPTQIKWTIIFSKNSTSWGSFSYDDKEDALRVQVKPHEAEFRESLAYTLTISSRIRRPPQCVGEKSWPFLSRIDGRKAIALRSIKESLRTLGGFSWAGYDEAANWLSRQQLRKLEQALKWRSIDSERRPLRE